tara:strand:+ start:773 stop:1876 length:1104 start_codon:yes stop_codon:yes gene_type:complete
MSKLKVAALQGLSASSDAITLANDGTCTANITNNLSNRNIIINGAAQIAQRGTSGTASPTFAVDRFPCYHYNVDEALTYAQDDVASGTTPYTLGFRKCIKITNGNQTSGPQGDGYAGWIQHRIEAQNIAQSGWNYTSASSYITLSFWVKSSVAQDFKGYLRSQDGTNQMYPFATGSLSADTWTKVTKTIPGNSNIQIDNNNEHGFQINFVPFIGTNYTDNSCTENAWAAYVSASRLKDVTTTWYNTNDATLEITGLQLEVGSVATDFEHRSYGQELALCQRYYEENKCTWAGYTAAAQGNGSLNVTYMTQKRTAATLTKKVSESSVQTLTSVNLQDAHISGFVVDTRVSSTGYGRFYDMIVASSAEL